MSIFSMVKKWRKVGRFVGERSSDYGELLVVEVAQAKTRVLRELLSMVALAIGVLFSMSFVCIAVIATAWQTPYFLRVVWAIAGLWMVVTIAAYLIFRSQKPVEPFKELLSEVHHDLEAIKGALNERQ
jgi:uncharacterized membrane protein YqjE